MKINIIIFYSFFSLTSSFIKRAIYNNLNIKMTNDDLGNIENKLDQLSKEMNKLKQSKISILMKTKGYKSANSTKNSNQLSDINSSNPYDNAYDNPFNNLFSNNDINNPFDDDDGTGDESDNFYNQEQNPFLPPIGIRILYKKNKEEKSDDTKSDNFQVYKNTMLNFTDVGGYSNIKEELLQCADLLVNYNKYSKFNVRTPKGLILEGPPGNGKTLLAKAFSGQINVSFIPVSGAEFQEKYVGVGASRVRELFDLAAKNKPCVIFIDEIDAVGRKRSGDGESHTSERDSTLNQLLVNLDGFKSCDGVFLMGSTNRIDLLDAALIRPGRIDKKIYVGNPDKATRESIIKIHIKGKPYDKTINIDQLVEMTNGFSGAQIENLLNEAMLYALRNNREIIKIEDLEIMVNRILVGWQSTKNHLSSELLYQVAIHEMGHAIVGLLANHKKLIKVTINLWSPNSLGFTLFETNEDEKNLITKDKLLIELMVLLGGRIAEEIFFKDEISSGASQDLDICKGLAETMINKYGMGSKNIISSFSDKNKEIIDTEVNNIIDEAYNRAKHILINSQSLIEECSKLLIDEHILTSEIIIKKINNKYSYLLKL